MTSVPARLRRAIATAAVVVILALLGGATYQGVATAVERRQYPHPGRLVDVGGHQLHIYCTGSGSPAVILEAPETAMSAAWGWVQPAVADHTRVCSYDRAGLGWSEAGDRGYDPSRVPDQLRALLDGAAVRGPIVIAGHGLGAAFATMYAARYRADVAAVVAIDSWWMEEGGAAPPDGAEAALAPWLARAGVLRATRALSRRAGGLPGASGGAMRAFLNRPDHLTRAARELAQWRRTVRMAQDARTAGDLPMTVVRSGAEGGSDSRVLLTDPERAAHVAAAIAHAVAEARRPAR